MILTDRTYILSEYREIVKITFDQSKITVLDVTRSILRHDLAQLCVLICRGRVPSIILDIFMIQIDEKERDQADDDG